VSIFSKILGGLNPLSLVREIIGVAGDFIESPDEKRAWAQKRMELEGEVLTLVQARDSEMEETLRAEIQAKERVLVAELQQGDKYTKRRTPDGGVCGVGVGAGE